MTLVASSKATVTPTLKLTQRLAPALRRLRAWALAKHIPGGVRDAEFLALVQRIDPTAMHDAPPIVQFVDGELAFNAVITALNSSWDAIPERSRTVSVQVARCSSKRIASTSQPKRMLRRIPALSATVFK